MALIPTILSLISRRRTEKPAPEKRTPPLSERLEMMFERRFEVARENLPFTPDTDEVFFYTPVPAPEIEEAIGARLDAIEDAFARKGLRFIFLPRFNQELGDLLNDAVLRYNAPGAAEGRRTADAALTYSDIDDALHLPEKVNGPCLLRCTSTDQDPLYFTRFLIQLPEDGDIMACIGAYLDSLLPRRLYSLSSGTECFRALEGRPADERFEEDVRRIGEEIRARILQLRAKGLSTLAIRKLVGDDADQPSRLLIDRNGRIVLPDFGNREICLSPIHKAVFFLFLRHPEGIAFKDLPDYREELGALYRGVSGREDPAAIQKSVDRLTDPLDNSINEKCARIKNAFVSEFREEIARWYIIDGRRGEKKRILLPRERVTWETASLAES